MSMLKGRPLPDDPRRMTCLLCSVWTCKLSFAGARALGVLHAVSCDLVELVQSVLCQMMIVFALCAGCMWLGKTCRAALSML